MVLTGHTLAPWKSAESLKQYKPTPIVTTNIIYKDYDPVTGNKVINDKYMIIHEIGRGVHGKVKLAQSLETDEYVAIKIVDKRTRKRQLSHAFLRPTQQTSVSIDKENEQKIRREIAILKKCVHPHVVQLKEVMDDPESNKIYMVLEYMDGGEIEWRDENDQPVLDIHEVRSIFRDVVCGLDYLHYQGVIHRDIKPANLLYSKDHIVKISDFGVSYFNKVLAGNKKDHSSMFEQQRSDQVDRELAETAGTPAFFAPELCWAGENRQEYRHKITRAIDIWALGVTLYCFVFGECPFKAATEYELFEIIPTQPLTFPSDNDNDNEENNENNNKEDIDNDLKDLLKKLLEKNPQDRITLDQVKEHPWVIKDLDQPEIWWEEANPRRYKPVQITDEDVTQAYTMMDRLKRSLHKLSSSFSNITKNITRRRSKSSSQSEATSPNRLAHFKISSTAPASSSALLTPTFSPPSTSTTITPITTTNFMQPSSGYHHHHHHYYQSSSSTSSSPPPAPPLPSSSFNALHNLNRTYSSSYSSLSNDSQQQHQYHPYEPSLPSSSIPYTSLIHPTSQIHPHENDNNNNNNNNNNNEENEDEDENHQHPSSLEKNQFHPIQSNHELSSTSLSTFHIKENHQHENNNQEDYNNNDNDDDDDDDDRSSHHIRPDYQRNNSTTSSMSGLVVSFGKKNRASALTPSFGFTKHHD